TGLRGSPFASGGWPGKSDRFIDYGTLHDRWKALLDADLEAARHLSEADKAHYSNKSDLDRSIQHLCQRQILFQGREWQCRRCFNRNWTTVDDMRGTLECQICKQTEPAPVSGDWHSGRTASSWKRTASRASRPSSGPCGASGTPHESPFTSRLQCACGNRTRRRGRMGRTSRSTLSRWSMAGYTSARQRARRAWIAIRSSSSSP